MRPVSNPVIAQFPPHCAWLGLLGLREQRQAQSTRDCSRNSRLWNGFHHCHQLTHNLSLPVRAYTPSCRSSTHRTLHLSLCGSLKARVRWITGAFNEEGPWTRRLFLNYVARELWLTRVTSADRGMGDVNNAARQATYHCIVLGNGLTEFSAPPGMPTLASFSLSLVMGHLLFFVYVCGLA